MDIQYYRHSLRHWQSCTVNKGQSLVKRRTPLATLVMVGLLTTACGGGGGTDVPPPPTRTIPESEFLLLDETNGPIGDPVFTSDIPVGDGVTASCTTQDWGESEVRTLVDTVGLNTDNTTVFPGALIEGKPLNDNGEFSVIKIPRAPGNIFMTGLLLEPGSQYTAENVDMSASGVNQAISNLITDNGILGTSANFGFTSSEAYSEEKFLFDLGVDGRYKNASLARDLSIGVDKTKNYSFVKFTQVYYDMNFDDSTLTDPTGVFRDGEKFDDSRNQINADSPPLYVSKVSYGRMVFFVAESTHDALEVSDALEGALNGGLAGEIAVNSGLTYENILARSKIYFHVVGGAADLALQPLDSATPEEMFSRVQQFIKDPASANFSASNPGAPIAYTLKYLKNSADARMSFSVNYDRNQCVHTHPAPPVRMKPVYYLQVANVIKGEVTVLVNGRQCGQPTDVAKEFDIYKCLTDNTVNDIVVDFNTSFGCNRTSVSWYIRAAGFTHHRTGGIILAPTADDGGHSPEAIIGDDVKCDDFFWTISIDTSQYEPRNAFSNFFAAN